MPEITKETRTFVGETAGAIGDGYAGFRIDRTYELHVEHRANDTVAIVLNHHDHVSPGAGPMVITEAQYGKWFKK
jgi:hypothetical protein